MPNSASSSASSPRASSQASPDRAWLHLGLFVLTLASTIYAGTLWVNRALYYETAGQWALWLDGIRYAVPLLGFLTVHEFGHYFAARHHGINTSLPYYIPFPFNGIGNFGAVIRIREPIPSMRTLFDIGASGPVAGFVVALGILLYAFATLPPPEYLLDQPGHEALKTHIEQYGTFPDEPPSLADAEGEASVLVVGQTPLFWALSQLFENVPPMYEIYHYPVLFAGWLGLFFTALNLLPVGQLDGGHVLYALFGARWHRRLARLFVWILLLSGSIGFMEGIQPALLTFSPVWGTWLSWGVLAGVLYLYNRSIFSKTPVLQIVSLGALLGGTAIAEMEWAGLHTIGYSGWLIWTLLILWLIRVEHPPVRRREPLSPARRWIGYLCIAIFISSFSLQPLSIM
jgi:membrane-associated protease RseP (regulator of RpoE activity)